MSKSAIGVSSVINGFPVSATCILVGLVTFGAESAVAAEQTVVKQAPASRSAQSVYQEQNALFSGNFTLETGLSYTRSDRKQLSLNGFLALDAIFLGDISVDEVKADILTLDVLARVGITPRLQVDIDAPFLYRRTVYQSTGAGGSTQSVSEEEVLLEHEVELGDMSMGMYYLLAPETASRPDIVWSLRGKAPTGSDPYGIKTVEVPGSNGNLRVPEYLPSGNGVWSVSTGLSFVKTVDPAILFANVGYFYNYRRSFDDIDSADGAQPGIIKLGDSFQYGMGTAFAFNETTSLSLSFVHRLTAKSRVKAAGSWHDIIGSDGNAATLNFGLTHALSKKTSMVFSLATGLTPDAPNMTVGVKFPHVF